MMFRYKEELFTRGKLGTFKNISFMVVFLETLVRVSSLRNLKAMLKSIKYALTENLKIARTSVAVTEKIYIRIYDVT